MSSARAELLAKLGATAVGGLLIELANQGFEWGLPAWVSWVIAAVLVFGGVLILQMED